MILNSNKIFLLLVFMLASNSFAQTNTEIDTLNAFEFSIPQEVVEFQLNNGNYLNEINRTFLNKFPLQDSSSVWLQARMMIGSFSNQSDNFSSSVSKNINPMFNDYLDSQKLATFRTILASVQVGAVAYLAYKHIKKYGFLKK